ncbi:hypothetical protein [Rhizobium tumorigenes]|uniref:Uncharacterized protein n=1 Tax=Rhizobium tumorigenes TaxID=2041385 RepID=A0AAF1KGE7_9HYPH|nr:hypothetical protein [Rhizobium tumorigenes]WFR95718.1 hypothetical protein PR017_00775 [Rhizobium tumorigenes]
MPYPKKLAVEKWETATGKSFGETLMKMEYEGLACLRSEHAKWDSSLLDVLSNPVTIRFLREELEDVLTEYIYDTREERKSRQAELDLQFKKAERNLLKVKHLLADVPPEAVSFWLGTRKSKRKHIFSEVVLQSLDDAITYFQRRKKRGPKENLAVEIAVERLIETFEALTRTNFRRNFKIEGSMRSSTASYINSDALFIEVIMLAIDNSITKSMIKTAFSKLPSKNDQELFQ